MKRVNISTLRDNLSRLLDAVRRGQEVEVLDRHVPIARIVPIQGVSRSSRKGRAWVEDLRRRGVATIGTLEPVPDILNKPPPGPAHTGAVEALIHERRTGR
jgi:prevent-host-death family protein